MTVRGHNGNGSFVFGLLLEKIRSVYIIGNNDNRPYCFFRKTSIEYAVIDL